MLRTCTILMLCCVMSTVNAQRKPKIKGNREVTEKQSELPFFYEVEVLDDIELTLEQGGSPGYRITADDNLVDVFRFRVQDSVLRITSFYQVTGKKKLEIVVNSPELSRLSVTDGKVKANKLRSDREFHLDLQGNASVDASIVTPYLTLELGSNSKSELDVETDTLMASLADRADLKLQSFYGGLANMTLEGQGRVRWSGELDSVSVAVRDNADLRAEDLDVAALQLVIQGRTQARVRANEFLYLDSRENARTNFYGEGRLIIQAFRGESALFREED